MSTSQKGLTLVELMVTIAVVAILAAVGIPMFQRVIHTNNAASGVNDLVTALQMARASAASRGVRTVVCPRDPSTLTCGTDWDNGWLVFADADKDGVLDSGEPVLRAWEAGKGRSYTVSASAIPFLPTGELPDSVTAPVTLQLDIAEGTGDHQVRCITLSANGLVRHAEGSCS